MTRLPASFFKFFRQEGLSECALACVMMIANYHNVDFAPATILNRRLASPRGINMLQLIELIQSIGLHPKALKGSFEEFLKEGELPCIAYWQQSHFVVVFDVNPIYIQVADPATGKLLLTHREFRDGWESIDAVPKQGLIVLVSE